MALVSLRDKRLFDGLIIRALDLELTDVSFPLDMEGGAEAFQRRSTKLRTLVADLSVEAFARHLQAGLTATQSPVRKLVLRPDQGVLSLEADLVLQDKKSRIVGQIAIAPAEPRAVQLVVTELAELGYFPVSSVLLADQLKNAIRHLLEPLGEKTADSLSRRGPGSIALDAVGAFFHALMPRNGWKVPAH